MNRFHSHIASAVKVIESYNGAQPFAQHLKKFFSAEKKYGSKDRKNIAALCYAYFRMGHAQKMNDKTERILTGLFLSGNDAGGILQHFKPEWAERIVLPPAEKAAYLNIRPEDIFPFQNELSAAIDKDAFALSFLKQPHLFLRARPGRHAAVLQKLNDAAIQYELSGEDCLVLPNAAKTETILKINREVVVQDRNSQRVLDYFRGHSADYGKDKKTNAWDCCAASGGKSILLYDRLQGNVRLTVSDIRETILANLKQRLEEAGISINRSFVADLRNAAPPATEKFHIVLCDAPCTGSGTWSRTPEQLFYFNRKKIAEYTALQEKIISHTVPALADNGVFIYITCSVFQEENEGMVDRIKEKFHLRLLQMEYLAGYNDFADTLFVAVFSK
jgi:16S rRNA (cytosine967-C5)-methyltransferase